MFDNFEGGDDKPAALFPDARWHAAYGKDQCRSNYSTKLEIDTSQGANGTSSSLRFDYSVHGAWADARVLFGGSWNSILDLSKLKGISFYVKSNERLPIAVTWSYKSEKHAGEVRHPAARVPAKSTWHKAFIETKSLIRWDPVSSGRT